MLCYILNIFFKTYLVNLKIFFIVKNNLIFIISKLIIFCHVFILEV